MSYYSTCPICGSNLDPGEKCDCKEDRRDALERARTKEGGNTMIKCNDYVDAVIAGTRIGLLVITCSLTVKLGKLALDELQGRTGYPGGEVLIMPLFGLLVYAGWVARREWIAYHQPKRR